MNILVNVESFKYIGSVAAERMVKLSQLIAHQNGEGCSADCTRVVQLAQWTAC